MVLKGMTLELYNALSNFRNRLVIELMEPPIIIEEDTTISKIIGLLIEKNAYEVFLKVGDSSTTSASIASVNVRDMLPVRDIVSAKPSVLGKIIPSLSVEDSTIGYAARIMSLYRLRSLPVVQRSHDGNGKRAGDIIGQVTAKSIVRAIYESGVMKTKQTAGTTTGNTAVLPSQTSSSSVSSKDVTTTIKASDIMTPDPIVSRPNEKVSSARGVMIRHRIDHLPIVNNNQKAVANKLVGILTSHHILQAMLPSEKIGRKSLGVASKIVRLDMPLIGVGEHNRDNITISNANDSLHSVVGLMLDSGSTYSIVQLFDELQGIITYRDVVSLLGEKVGEVEDIPAFIIVLPEDPFDAELAKSKFINIVKLLRKISPEIEEARCHMKIRDIEGERRRYEVDTNIITPYRRYTYRNIGWDLARMFDQMSDSLKKKIAHKRSRRGLQQRESVRYMDTSSGAEEEST
jgi:CBS domain-containing protein